MTRQLPRDIQAIGRALDTEAGTYLRSTVREPGTTCTVCTAPVEGFSRCVQCNRHAASEFTLADRVGPLIYAVEPDSQAYKVVRNYKAARPGPAHTDTMRALLALGLRGHHGCANRMSGLGTHGWAVVPSTRDRTTLRDLVAGLSQRADAEVLVSFVGDVSSRELRPEDWQITAPDGIAEHVLLVDDSWVTGAHSQAVAAALKAAGARQVSIFTVARVLRPDWPANDSFIRTRLTQPGFAWARCPWTGNDCP